MRQDLRRGRLLEVAASDSALGVSKEAFAPGSALGVSKDAFASGPLGASKGAFGELLRGGGLARRWEKCCCGRGVEQHSAAARGSWGKTLRATHVLRVYGYTQRPLGCCDELLFFF